MKNKIKEQKIYQSLKKKALNRIIRRVRETNLQVSFRCWCSEMQRDKKSQALMLYFDLQNENKQVLKYFRKLNSNKIRRKIKREFGRRKKKKIEISVFWIKRIVCCYCYNNKFYSFILLINYFFLKYLSKTKPKTI